MQVAAEMRPLVLASQSPRRRELLQQVGLPFHTHPVAIDETPWPDEDPGAYVDRMAVEKAREGVRQLASQGRGAPLILAADTSVIHQHRILGKPGDARAMLEALSGDCHQVITSVALADGAEVALRRVVTDVWFRALSPAEIDAYLATDEPWDKAGAYGIQGRGGLFVARISGSYSAVVGLPLQETAQLLAKAGQPVWTYWEPRA